MKITITIQEKDGELWATKRDDKPIQFSIIFNSGFELSDKYKDVICEAIELIKKV